MQCAVHDDFISFKAVSHIANDVVLLLIVFKSEISSLLLLLLLYDLFLVLFSCFYTSAFSECSFSSILCYFKSY